MVSGAVSVNGEGPVPVDHVVFASRARAASSIESRAKAALLVLSGAPLDEPVVSYGPFVMNTEGEIRQAMIDFQDGKFGSLDD